MNTPEWYGAKTVYKCRITEDGAPKTVYEERVVLFRATDFEDAIAKAEAEAAGYISTSDPKSQNTYLGFVDVYHLFDETVGDGTEVYSSMRESNLSENEYLNRYYDNAKDG